MTTPRITIPTDAFTLTDSSSCSLSNTTLHNLDTSFWLYGLAASFVQHNDIYSLTSLIEQGLDVRFNDDYLLHVAVDFNHINMVLFLVDKGLSVNAAHNGNSVLECAAYRGYYEMCDTLLALGADPCAELHDPVFSAAKYGNLKICKLLLRVGAKVDISNLYRNPCAAAIDGGHAATLDTLLTHLGDSINLNSLVNIRLNTLSQECAIVMVKHGATMENISKKEFEKLITAPTKFIAKLTPAMSGSLIQRAIDLFAQRSKRSVHDLMANAPEWQRPYYMSALAKGM